MAREIVTLSVMGMDQHENGVLAVAQTLREAQMQVRYLGRFQTPERVAEQALGDGTQVIGISCHSWEYLELVPRLLEAIRRHGCEVPVVVGGSVITADDAAAMKAAGVAAVFTAGARDTEIIDCIRDLAAGRIPDNEGEANEL